VVARLAAAESVISLEEVMTKRLLRLLRIAPLALLFAGYASAQTTGTIIGVVTDASTGKPVAGAVVIATSPNLQGEQTVVTDASGNYRLVQLPPGDYKLAVQLEGYKPFERSDIVVRVDKTIRTPLSVVPEAVQMEEQVVRTGAAPVVNVGSAESGAVVSQEFISSVPVGRGFEQIAAVVPTATVNPTIGVGFAGAQAVENQYNIDGLNTTDVSHGGRSGDGGNNGPPSLRSNFTQEIDVKTGNFGAEYGRATGGVLNVVLKSGSNEFHGSVFSAYAPNFLVQPTASPTGAAGEAIAWRSKPSEGAYQLDFGAEVGGPILKDKLWFYAGFAPVVTVNTYDRFLRQNVMPVDTDGDPDTDPVCADGQPAAGGYGECLDSNDRSIQTTIPGTSKTLETNRTSYQLLGKLTYLLDENNSFSVTGWGVPSSRSFLGSGFAVSGTLYNAPSNDLQYEDQSQASVLGRWGGKFLDKRLITEVQAGWINYTVEPVAKNRAGVSQLDAPAVEWLYSGATPWAITDFEDVPEGYCTDPATCPVNGYTTGGAGFSQNYSTNRYVARASAAYLLENLGGQHNIKGGVDLERLDYEVSNEYTGGAYYTAGTNASGAQIFSAFRGYGTIANPGVDPATGVRGLEIADARLDPTRVNRTRQANTSETDSFAYYLQDSWQPSFLPNVTLNLGVRLETQSMKNLDFEDLGSTGFEINDNWSPRVQAIWDFTGTGRGKVAGSWGRFYYAMPLDMGNRAFGQDIQLRYNLLASSCSPGGIDPRTFDTRQVEYESAAGTGFRSSTCQLDARGGASNDLRLTGAPLTPADPDLKGSYVDQFGGQVEYEILPDLALRADYQGRRQGYVIEDMSSNDGSDYYIGNPGKDTDIFLPDGTFAGNSKYVDSFDANTGKPIRIEFPKPERSYDGITLSATKLFSKNWLAQVAYTYSALRGNYSGPFFPEYGGGQLDPGITAEYDLASLMGNKTGYLPGDQTHQVKLYGAYNWNFGPRMSAMASAAYTGLSGTPVSALGAHPDYGQGLAFIVPRGQAGRTPFTNTVDVGAGLNYVVRAPYAVNFRVDVFNVFNSEEVQQIDPNYTFDSVTPAAGIDCDGRNAVSKSNPIQAIQADCPGLAYLKSVDGHPVTINPNFGKQDTGLNALQVPISMRFTLALQF
jgi:hypothetical protein